MTTQTDPICTAQPRDPDTLLHLAGALISRALREHLGEDAPSVFWANIADSESNPDRSVGRFQVHTIDPPPVRAMFDDLVKRYDPNTNSFDPHPDERK